MSKSKKKIREQFRKSVFERDNYTCQVCKKKFEADDLDAHHIVNREEFEDGGYFLENGITLCKIDDNCHLKVEKGEIKI